MNAMFTYTFGVEIEMYRITRRQAAEVITRELRAHQERHGLAQTADFWHSGGVYDAWSVYESAQGRIWQLARDSSIEAPASHQCELVTPILTWDDIELLQNLVRALRKAGARSDPSHSCGIHVHVGGNHDAKSLHRLVNIMASHEQLLCQALGLSSARTTRWCCPVNRVFLFNLGAKRPATISALQELWYDCQPSDVARRVRTHYDSSRYRMLNLHSFFQGKGVEFRLFQFDDFDASAPAGRRGGIHAGQLKAYIMLCLALNHRALTSKSASPAPLVSDNPKYTMRCWLLRLGFIGDEFQAAREHLTRRLPGDASWRHGRPNG